MATKHQVTDKNGKVHKRTSQSRVYAFAVVRHWESYSYDIWNAMSADEASVHISNDPQLSYNQETGHVRRTLPAGSAACWCGRRDLAEKQAAADRKYSHTVDVEIIPTGLGAAQ